MGHAYLTYLGRSLKVSNFWNSFGPQGRFDEKLNLVSGWGNMEKQDPGSDQIASYIQENRLYLKNSG